MIASDAMLDSYHAFLGILPGDAAPGPMTKDAPQGNAGMGTATANSACFP
jgi:hypothetical protein